MILKQKALDSLLFAIERTERKKPDDMLRDSVIQRFEYSYELCWKMLKRRLEMDVPSAESIDAMSFREMIREGAERGLINDPLAWFGYHQKRNLTMHTYPALFINAAAPLLVPPFKPGAGPLPATNPCSGVRKHGYALFRKNPLRTKARRNHHGDS